MHLGELREIVAEILEVEEDILVDGFEHANHPNWDSLAILSFMTAIQDEVGILLDNASLKSCVTVEELHSLIEAVKGR